MAKRLGVEAFKSFTKNGQNGFWGKLGNFLKKIWQEPLECFLSNQAFNQISSQIWWKKRVKIGDATILTYLDPNLELE